MKHSSDLLTVTLMTQANKAVNIMLLYSADIMGAHCLKVKFFTALRSSAEQAEAALNRLKQCCRSGYIHSTFVCDLGMLLLQLYSLFSAHIMFAVFSLYLLSTARTLPAFGITVQILYDTCNSTLNVINYDCHSFAVLLLIFCGCQTHFLLYHRRAFY